MMNKISILKHLLVNYAQVNIVPYTGSNCSAKQDNGSECLP